MVLLFLYGVNETHDPLTLLRLDGHNISSFVRQVEDGMPNNKRSCQQCEPLLHVLLPLCNERKVCSQILVRAHAIYDLLRIH